MVGPVRLLGPDQQLDEIQIHRLKRTALKYPTNLWDPAAFRYLKAVLNSWTLILYVSELYLQEHSSVLIPHRSSNYAPTQALPVPYRHLHMI